MLLFVIVIVFFPDGTNMTEEEDSSTADQIVSVVNQLLIDYGTSAA